MTQRLRSSITQWGMILLPFLLTALLGMTSYSVYQINKALDSKADQRTLDATCKDFDNRINVINENVAAKANNETLIKMLDNLRQKDEYLEKANKTQDIRLDRQRDIQAQQLEVLQQIKIEIVKLNPRGIIK